MNADVFIDTNVLLYTIKTPARPTSGTHNPAHSWHADHEDHERRLDIDRQPTVKYIDASPG